MAPMTYLSGRLFSASAGQTPRLYSSVLPIQNTRTRLAIRPDTLTLSLNYYLYIILYTIRRILLNEYLIGRILAPFQLPILAEYSHYRNLATWQSTERTLHAFMPEYPVASIQLGRIARPTCQNTASLCNLWQLVLQDRSAHTVR